jgi:hypothetical protein
LPSSSSDAAKVFEVTNPEIVGLFGWQDTVGKATNYSFNDLKPFFTEIEKQAALPPKRNPLPVTHSSAVLSNCTTLWAYTFSY